MHSIRFSRKMNLTMKDEAWTVLILFAACIHGYGFEIDSCSAFIHSVNVCYLKTQQKWHPNERLLSVFIRCTLKIHLNHFQTGLVCVCGCVGGCERGRQREAHGTNIKCSIVWKLQHKSFIGNHFTSKINVTIFWHWWMMISLWLV